MEIPMTDPHALALARELDASLTRYRRLRDDYEAAEEFYGPESAYTFRCQDALDDAILSHEAVAQNFLDHIFDAEKS
jgi:hypothetical protein